MKEVKTKATRSKRSNPENKKKYSYKYFYYSRSSAFVPPSFSLTTVHFLRYRLCIVKVRKYNESRRIVIQMYMQWFNFIFSETFIFLLLCMLIVDHGFETNEKKIKTRGKIEPTRILCQCCHE